MKAELTVSNLYYNPSLLNFFFRTQARKEFNELFDKVEESNDDVFDSIENYSNDLDEIEEIFYDETFEHLCDIFRLTPIEQI